MKTRDWEAKNTPAGPPLTIRCQCGGKLATLPVGATLLSDSRSSADMTIMICNLCENQVFARVTGGPNGHGATNS